MPQVTNEKQSLINLLQIGLAFEYSAAIQYYQHAAMIGGVYFAFSSDLLTHGDEEIGHAKKLNDLIAFHGGVPLVEVTSRFMASNSVSMLKQDHEGEIETIARYKAYIEAARAQGEYGIVSVLLEILADEEHHANDLKSILADEP
jgi:bacterioferritin (cytochrome b1)